MAMHPHRMNRLSRPRGNGIIEWSDFESRAVIQESNDDVEASKSAMLACRVESETRENSPNHLFKGPLLVHLLFADVCRSCFCHETRVLGKHPTSRFDLKAGLDERQLRMMKAAIKSEM